MAQRCICIVHLICNDAEDKYRTSFFDLSGYERKSPWYKTRSRALGWAAEYFS
jgi:hypothetical protein